VDKVCGYIGALVQGFQVLVYDMECFGPHFNYVI
jgi:hypothetical protein